MKLMIGKLIIIVATGLLLFGYAEVWGADWKPLRPSKDGDSYYYDASSIVRPSKNIVRGLIKRVYSEKSLNREVEKLGSTYKDMSHRIILWEMNCIEKKAAFIEITTYSKKGAVLSSIKPDKPSWAAIPPESISEELYKLLCK
jgi:hypothetical protein